jgi:hypothetical protein
MRFLLKAVMDTEKANVLFERGTLSSTMGEILAAQKPEAAYFVAEDGRRTAYLFVNFDKPSDVPRFCEPWFTLFGAQVSIQPAMTADDLRMALAAPRAA